MTPGQEVKIGDYIIRPTRCGHRRRPEADGHGRHDHSKNGSRDHEDVSGALVLPQARGSADDGSRDSPDVRRRSVHRDAAFDAAEQSANIEITVNPLVNWVWLGFGLLAFGTFIALLPEDGVYLCRRRVPESAKTATASLLLLAIVLPAAVQAQDGSSWPARKQDDDAA